MLKWILLPWALITTLSPAVRMVWKPKQPYPGSGRMMSYQLFCILLCQFLASCPLILSYKHYTELVSLWCVVSKHLLSITLALITANTLWSNFNSIWFIEPNIHGEDMSSPWRQACLLGVCSHSIHLYTCIYILKVQHTHQTTLHHTWLNTHTNRGRNGQEHVPYQK